MSRVVVLRTRDFFKDAEDFSRLLKGTLMMRCDRVRTTEQTPCAKHRVLEHRHGLPDIIEHKTLSLSFCWLNYLRMPLRLILACD